MEYLSVKCGGMRGIVLKIGFAFEYSLYWGKLCAFICTPRKSLPSGPLFVIHTNCQVVTNPKKLSD
jgi:hypothetical protein